MMQPYALYASPEPEIMDWEAFCSWVARFSTGLSDENYDKEQDQKLVKRCRKQGHLSVFEHWPVTVHLKQSECGEARDILLMAENPAVLTTPSWYQRDRTWRTNLRVLWLLDEAGLRPGWDHGHPKEPHRHRLETFEIGCSRGCADELRTYRVLTSYVMESQRRVFPAGVIYKASQPVQKLAEAALTMCYNLTTTGLKNEDVKEAFPRAAVTRFVMTSTLSGWSHIIQQRLVGTTGRPEAEIRKVASHINESLVQRYGVSWASEYCRQDPRC